MSTFMLCLKITDTWYSSFSIGEIFGSSAKVQPLKFPDSLTLSPTGFFWGQNGDWENCTLP